jgi:hypothetical protein
MNPKQAITMQIEKSPVKAHRHGMDKRRIYN